MIQWPQDLVPGRAPVYVRNVMSIAAPIENVWEWLIRAELWPTWYPNSHRVRIERGPKVDLGLGTEFVWRTFGVVLRSRVTEFSAPNIIAWNARSLGIQAYHAWTLMERSEGCEIVSEETQRGIMARLGSILLPNRMFCWHQIWLSRLAVRAQTGRPSQSSRSRRGLW
jgi:uncharacterized protein YndB with AHSA1/START domain